MEGGHRENGTKQEEDGCQSPPDGKADTAQSRHGTKQAEMMNAGRMAVEQTREEQTATVKGVCLTYAGLFLSGGWWCGVPPAGEGKGVKVSE